MPMRMRDATPPQPVGGWRTALPTATLALALVAAVATATVGAPPAARPASILPWLTWAINAVFWSQVALVALFAVVTAVQARSLPRPAPVALTTSGSGGAVVTSPAWRGLAAPVFALLGWIVGSGFAAALALRIADTVGTPIAAVDAVSAATRKATSGETGPYAGKQILLPVGYFWASAAAAVSLGVVLVVGVVMVVRVMNNVGRMRPVVDEQYDAGVGADDERVGQIARVWAIAQAPNLARVLAAFLVSGVAVVLVLGLAGYAWDEQWIVNHGWAGLLLVGNLVMTLAVAGLLWAGRQAYSNQRFRRTIGVLWDIGTFWPRATHPLAPPSYGERAVPDLLYRIEGLTRLDGPDAGREDLVVLSCHSQGTVIGAAVVAASRYQALARTAFFTYGNPLRRIYARFFPAYFGIEQLDRLGRLLVTGSGDDDRAMQQAAGLTRARTGGTDSDAGERAAWPWRSLQRPSDPIGGPVFVDAAPATAPPPDGTEPLSRDVDVTLLDPTFHRSRGDRTWPAALGHSDYDRDPLYPAARADVIVLRRRPGAAAPAPAGLPPAPRQDEPVTP